MTRREVRWVTAEDDLLAPLLRDLAREYDARYEPNDGVPSSAELTRYAPEVFTAAQGGAFVAVLEHGVLVAGGAIKRGSPGPTGSPLAEIKRMWTHPDHRRRGLAGLVLHELEHRAVDLGYGGLELTTGARQPEAVGLYLHHGWRPDFRPTDDFESIGHLRFTRSLVRQSSGSDTC